MNLGQDCLDNPVVCMDMEIGRMLQNEIILYTYIYVYINNINKFNSCLDIWNYG